MITVCPKCALTLAVTAADLRVGQGQVRCGRCAAIFNALAALQDDFSETIEQAAPQELRTAHDTFDPGATDVPSEARTPSELIDAPVDSAADFPPAANDPQPLTSTPANDDIIEPPVANESDINLQVDVDARVAAQPSQVAAAVAALDLDLTPPAPPQPPRRWIWAASVAALAFLLAAQLMHANRHDLAFRDGLRGPLTKTYALFGARLEPAWHVEWFEVRRSGEMVADDKGVMTLRATVQNLAPQSQPLPLLRVVLLDRFGARLAARDLQPQEYLPVRVAAATPLLAAGQRVDAEVALADPGPTAAGFELDACLANASGALRCASKSATSSP
jgi:predicted Zn finger-like uncharacterized protein